MQTTVIYSDGQTLKTNQILRKWLGSIEEINKEIHKARKENEYSR